MTNNPKSDADAAVLLDILGFIHATLGAVVSTARATGKQAEIADVLTGAAAVVPASPAGDAVRRWLSKYAEGIRHNSDALLPPQLPH
jgi:hypothetical protein